MTGRITGISGPTVRAALEGARLFERVLVGRRRLAGEVVRLEQGQAVVQVYESTEGLTAGEPVAATGMPLSVLCAPGILSRMFDGLQRPLEQFRQLQGAFLSAAQELPPLATDIGWEFEPLARPGDCVMPGGAFGFVREGSFRHLVMNAETGPRTVGSIAAGSFTITQQVGESRDGRPILLGSVWPVRKPRPYRRKFAPREPLVTGQRSIDFLFPLVRGGTAVIPGGFGTGKTVLQQSIAKCADIDIVVYVGCGERGNEMAEMIDEFRTLADPCAGSGLMQRTVLVVNTSNMPVAAREASIYTAVAMAEYYRDMGYHVLFIADSLSRWAEALREISSSLEEMPGDEGYPTYLASRIAGFIERAGVVETLSGANGSLSMVLSVSPPGGDFSEPVTQACLRAAGAFLMLDTGLAHRRHFPALNWSQSYSLYAAEAAELYCGRLSPEWKDLQQWMRELLQKEEELREIAEIVGLEGMQDADRVLLRAAEAVRTGFLAQNAFAGDGYCRPDETLARIRDLKARADEAAEMLGKGASLGDALGRFDEIR